MSQKSSNSRRLVAEAASSPEVTVGKKSSSDMKALGGSGFALWDTQLLHRTAGTASPAPQGGEDAASAHRRNVGVAALALHAFAPKDPVEAMIASQAMALHLASLECSRRAMVPQQSPDVASRLRRDAANSARAMVDMCEALDRRRGKGTQVVRVERVVVNEGGQAVVGNVSTASLPSSPPAIRPGLEPMIMLETQLVAAGEGEGA